LHAAGIEVERKARYAFKAAKTAQAKADKGKSSGTKPPLPITGTAKVHDIIFLPDLVLLGHFTNLQGPKDEVICHERLVGHFPAGSFGSTSAEPADSPKRRPVPRSIKKAAPLAAEGARGCGAAQVYRQAYASSAAFTRAVSAEAGGSQLLPVPEWIAERLHAGWAKRPAPR
jgi:hypothetical protein